MANLTDLEQLKQQYINEIRRRGGAAKAPGFVAKLNEVEAQIRAMQAPASQPSAELPIAQDAAGSAVDAMANEPDYLTMNEADLMAARDRTEKAIRNKGGKAAAPNYAKRLTEIDNALSALRKSAGVSGPPGDNRAPLPAPGGQVSAPVAPPPTVDPNPQNPGLTTGDIGSTDLVPGQGPPPYNNIPGGPISQFPNDIPGQEQTVVDTTSAIKDPATGIKAEQEAADLEATKNLQLGNPNQVNPFGNRAVTRDAQGNITVTDSLSGGQQKILSQDEQLSNVGRELAIGQLQSGAFGDVFTPQLSQRWSSGDLATDRQRVEDAIFAKFTRDQDQQKQLEEQQLRSRLNVQGIPFSADPNSRYQQEMRAFNNRYDTLKENARQTATQMGGEEYQRNFGINEQLIANELAQQQGIRNQRFGDVNQLSNMGTGLMLPNFQGYNAPTYNTANPMDIYGAFEQLNDADKDRALQKWIATQQLKKSGSGGGGGGSSSSAFEGL